MDCVEINLFLIVKKIFVRIHIRVICLDFDILKCEKRCVNFDRGIRTLNKCRNINESANVLSAIFGILNSLFTIGIIQCVQKSNAAEVA